MTTAGVQPGVGTDPLVGRPRDRGLKVRLVGSAQGPERSKP